MGSLFHTVNYARLRVSVASFRFQKNMLLQHSNWWEAQTVYHVIEHLERFDGSGCEGDGVSPMLCLDLGSKGAMRGPSAWPVVPMAQCWINDGVNCCIRLCQCWRGRWISPEYHGFAVEAAQACKGEAECRGSREAPSESCCQQIRGNIVINRQSDVFTEMI